MSSGADSTCKTKVLPPELILGQVLKQFRLERVLGEGGMGVVYRAFDTHLCRPVAIKVLPTVLTSDAERKLRFLQEARAAARINHPAIAQIFAVDEHEGTTFIIMELVEGKTVRELVLRRELDLLGAVDIAIQIADGLAKAHELGIVHRDIKPANVMVTAEGRVKILDFGLAKWLDRPLEPGGSSPAAGDTSPVVTTLPGVVLGTAAYMSPEQVRGIGVDGRSDIFSLGVLLFEMATGRSPFQRENFMDSLHAVAFDEAPSLGSFDAHLPEELQRIVLRCLRKEPAERYAEAQRLADDLRVLRRNAESGLAGKTSWRVRLNDAWERFCTLRPSQYVWFILGATAGGAALYLSMSRIGTGGMLCLAFVAIYLYRFIRNRPHRMQETFVRRVAKIPEVLLIVLEGNQFTILVEHPTSQLYTRINQQLRMCNRKLYFGPSLTVAIRQDVSPESTQRLLIGPGVQFVRQDLLS